MSKKSLIYLIFIGSMTFLIAVILIKYKNLNNTDNHKSELYSKNALTEVNVKRKNIDIGKIAVDEAHKAKGLITLYNSGNKDLYIDKIEVSCSCTSGSIPRRPIAPKDSFNLVVSYNKTIPGYFYSDVIVHGNFENSPMILSFEGQLSY